MEKLQEKNKIPVFDLVLDDSKIERIEVDSKPRTKLNIKLRNNGMVAARCVANVPGDKNTKDFVTVTSDENTNLKFKCDLVPAIARGAHANLGRDIEFNITVFLENLDEIFLKNPNKIGETEFSLTIHFRVEFYDALDNLYHQDHEIYCIYDSNDSTGVEYRYQGSKSKDPVLGKK